MDSLVPKSCLSFEDKLEFQGGARIVCGLDGSMQFLNESGSKADVNVGYLPTAYVEMKSAECKNLEFQSIVLSNKNTSGIACMISRGEFSFINPWSKTAVRLSNREFTNDGNLVLDPLTTLDPLTGLESGLDPVTKMEFQGETLGLFGAKVYLSQK